MPEQEQHTNETAGCALCPQCPRCSRIVEYLFMPEWSETPLCSACVAALRREARAAAAAHQRNGGDRRSDA
jgi:hypothetical protein